MRTLVTDGYSLDTSAIIDLADRYPREVFEGVWVRLGDLAVNKRLVCSAQVLRELEFRADEAHTWAKQQDGVFEPVDQHWGSAQRIAKTCPGIVDFTRTTPQADPYVIAIALDRGWTVITSERRRGGIPEVCKQFAVKCTDLLGLFRLESWKFKL